MRARTRLCMLHTLSLPMHLSCNSHAERLCAASQVDERQRMARVLTDLSHLFSITDYEDQ